LNRIIVFFSLFSFFLVSCGPQKNIGHNETSLQKRQHSISAIPGTKSVPQEEVKTPVVPPKKFIPKKRPLSKHIAKYCKKVDRKFHKYGWKKSHCEKLNWHHVRNSFLGDPLIWLTYGKEVAEQKNIKNTTLILCGVHGDEITPVKFCFDIINHLEKSFMDHPNDLVVVAPVVNPDSFFKRRPTRTNHNGIDINRNFPTKDWQAKAIKLWKKRYRKDRRRNPGKRPLSEQETIFQVNLIKRYAPNKIISVHAPLTMLDYDGPDHSKQKETIGSMANQLLVQMSKQANGYKIRNYPFFPGSLGNWAGNEQKIPTYTLELPSSDNRNSRKYWNLFKDAIHSAIFSDFGRKKKIALLNLKNSPADIQEEKKSQTR
jgi:murein peptide amidase A